MKEAVYQGHGQIESYSIDSALWGVIAHEQRHANFNKYISFLKKKDVKEDIKLTIQYKDGRPVPVKAYTEAKIKSSKKDEDFIGHVTIARIKSRCDCVKEIIEKYKDTEFGTVDVERFHLKNSKLTRSGPIYYTVKTYELRG